MTYKQDLQAQIIATTLKINEMHLFMLETKAMFDSGSISFEEFDLVLTVTEDEAEKLVYEGETLMLIADALYSSNVK